MRANKTLLCAALLCMGAVTQASAATAIPGYITAAVADASRPERDVQRDVNRKPAEVLTFAGVKPGDKVGELLPGGGYFTKLFCKIVGDAGHVYTMNVSRPVATDRPSPDVGSGMAAAPAPTGTPCANITADAKLAAEMSLPGGLDLVWTSENYHDLHNKMFGSPDMVKFNKAVFDALKPGGVYMVEDHAAQAGSGARDTDTLHRIDAEQVKKEVTAAGFVFEAASDALHNPADNHDAKVFELKGQSDKFLLKFRKSAR
jgi:predicted methyltransferase